MHIWETLKNVKIIWFFYLFWNFLNIMRHNLRQRCVKEGFLSFQGKTETIAPDFPGKMTVSSSFDPTIPPVPLYNLAFPPKQKLYF